jgi:hypothetical protein
MGGRPRVLCGLDNRVSSEVDGDCCYQWFVGETAGNVIYDWKPFGLALTLQCLVDKGPQSFHQTPG